MKRTNGAPSLRRGTIRGQTLVEFALALPLFIVIVVGIFDFGHAVYKFNTIANAARIANRVAIVDQNEPAVDAAALQEAVGVGLVEDDVNMTIECQKIGCLVEVTIEHTYIPATPVINFLVGDITLRATSEMPIERVFPAPGG